MLDKDEDSLLLGLANQFLVLFEEFHCGFGDEDMDAALDGVERDGVVSRVWGEDGDGVAGTKTVNGRLVSVRVLLVVGGKGFK